MLLDSYDDSLIKIEFTDVECQSSVLDTAILTSVIQISLGIQGVNGVMT
jgi:hypothetical protein